MRKVDLESLLATFAGDPAGRLRVFALVSLGIVESLSNGTMSATDATRFCFHVDNHFYVRKTFKTVARRFMSHGRQLADLFDILPAEDANRGFLHEPAIMKSLCVKLIEEKHLVA